MLLGGDSIKVKEINSYEGETLSNLKLRNQQMLGRDSIKINIRKLGFLKHKFCQNF